MYVRIMRSIIVLTEVHLLIDDLLGERHDILLDWQGQKRVQKRVVDL